MEFKDFWVGLWKLKRRVKGILKENERVGKEREIYRYKKIR